MTRHPAQSQLHVRCAQWLRTMAARLVLLQPVAQYPVILQFCKHRLGVCEHPCIHVSRRQFIESSVCSAAMGFRVSVEKDKAKRNLPTVAENGRSGPVCAPAARWPTRRCVQRLRISQNAARQAGQATSPVLKCGQRPCSYFPDCESIQPWYIGQMTIHRESGSRPTTRELQSRYAVLCGFPFPSRMVV